MPDISGILGTPGEYLAVQPAVRQPDTREVSFIDQSYTRLQLARDTVAHTTHSSLYTYSRIESTLQRQGFSLSGYGQKLDVYL